MTLELGSPVDLLGGLRPAFGTAPPPWCVPPERPLRTEAVPAPGGPVHWQAPELSLHDDAADLLGRLFDLQAVPMPGLDGPLALDPGILMTGDGVDPETAASALGLPLEAGQLYLLVRLRGLRDPVYYTPEWQGLNRMKKLHDWLSPEGRHAMARLRLAAMRRDRHLLLGDVTARQASRYLEYFHRFGTHILRSLQHGDILFQVFRVAPGMRDALRIALAPELVNGAVTGPAVHGLAPFTRAPWTDRAGPIRAASGAAAAVRDDPIWQDESEAPSLLSTAAIDAARRAQVLDRLPACTPLAASFACQALYLEDHRAEAWTRLLRGALVQRFPELRDTGWPAPDRMRPVPLLAEAGLTHTSTADPPEIALAWDAAPVPAATAGARPPRLALFTDARDAPGGVARLAVGCGSADRPPCLPFCDGAVQIADGGDRLTLVEGAWLGRAIPQVAADPAMADPALLLRHASQLAGWLRLLDLLQGPALPDGVGPHMRRAAAWLAGAARGQTGLEMLQGQAALVAGGAGWASTLAGQGLAQPAATCASLAREVLALLALPLDHAAQHEAAARLATRLAACHAPGAVPPDPEGSAQALAQRFAGLKTAHPWPETEQALLRAAAILHLPPDPKGLPHRALPGDGRVEQMWNALLGLRARLAELRATQALAAGQGARAAHLLEVEALAPHEVQPDPATVLAQALRQAADDAALPELDALQQDMTAMTDMAAAAWRWRRMTAMAATPGTAPALLRLTLVLEVLALCRLSGSSKISVQGLSPRALAAALEAALDGFSSTEPRAGTRG